MLNPILIIDDDLDYIQSLNYELHEENIILDSCQNGVDGIEYLKNHPDLELIILDLNLLDCEPVPENIDPVLLINMLYRIKPTIKIIVNTEKSPLLSRKKAEDLNISLYLEKSENLGTLLFNIKKVLHQGPYSFQYLCINDQTLFEDFKKISNIELINFDHLSDTIASDLIEKIYAHYTTLLNKHTDPCIRVIQNIVTSKQSLDSLMFLSNKRYRDHYKHQLRVGLIGSYFLETEFNDDGEKLITHFRNTGSTKGMTQDELYLSWWIASLLHDYCYPVSFIFKNMSQYRYITQNFPIEKDHYAEVYSKILTIYNDYFVGELLFELINSLKSDNDDKIRQKVEYGLSLIFNSQIPSEHKFKMNLLEGYQSFYDHGVLSAVNLALKIGASNITKQIKIALKAIALHNNKNIKLDFEDEPLASLLVISDELQEWGRDVIVNGNSVHEINDIYILFKLYKNSRRVFSDNFSIQFNYTDSDILEKTSWNYSTFINSKESNLKRVCINNIFKSSIFEIKTSVPCLIKPS